MIFDVTFKMIGKLIDAVSEQRNLDVRAASVFFVHAQRLNILSVCHS